VCIDNNSCKEKVFLFPFNFYVYNVAGFITRNLTMCLSYINFKTSEAYIVAKNNEFGKYA
jgi:hypothetical protein